jgi:hypothetical protein
MPKAKTEYQYKIIKRQSSVFPPIFRLYGTKTDEEAYLVKTVSNGEADYSIEGLRQLLAVTPCPNLVGDFSDLLSSEELAALIAEFK